MNLNTKPANTLIEATDISNNGAYFTTFCHGCYTFYHRDSNHNCEKINDPEQIVRDLIRKLNRQWNP